MSYDVKNFSYGVELEYGNCYRFNPLPEGASWNNKDNTCVSTTGIANDPDGILYKYGGEINTRPTFTIEEQINHIEQINAMLDPKPVVNYRSNLHIHIRVPGLSDDLESCKKLLRYITEYQEQAFWLVEHIPEPSKPDKSSPNYEKLFEIYFWENKRYIRRKKSHQHKLPKDRVEAMLNAKTTKEFYEEHAPLTEKGRMWFFAPRAGINLRQMWEETNTIEFRHFPGTLYMAEMKSCLIWCREFLNAALNTGATPQEIYESYNFCFPKFEPYEYETEQMYQLTNFDGNTKKVIAKRLKVLREHIDIDTAPSKEVFAVYQHLKKEGKIE
jgi:hypothetical protein